MLFFCLLNTDKNQVVHFEWKKFKKMLITMTKTMKRKNKGTNLQIMNILYIWEKLVFFEFWSTFVLRGYSER